MYVQSYKINVLDRVFIHDDILGEIAREMKVKMNNLCDVTFAIKKHLPSNGCNPWVRNNQINLPTYIYTQCKEL